MSRTFINRHAIWFSLKYFEKFSATTKKYITQGMICKSVVKSG